MESLLVASVLIYLSILVVPLQNAAFFHKVLNKRITEAWLQHSQQKTINMYVNILLAQQIWALNVRTVFKNKINTMYN